MFKFSSFILMASISRSWRVERQKHILAKGTALLTMVPLQRVKSINISNPLMQVIIPRCRISALRKWAKVPKISQSALHTAAQSIQAAGVTSGDMAKTNKKTKQNWRASQSAQILQWLFESNKVIWKLLLVFFCTIILSVSHHRILLKTRGPTCSFVQLVLFSTFAIVSPNAIVWSDNIRHYKSLLQYKW